MRFLHIADVHLDSPFAGRSEAMRTRLRRASLTALRRCVATAVAEQVDAVLIAGDLFDGAYLSFETERFLLGQLNLLSDEGIQVVYATGNHDPGQGSRAGDLEWPDSVTVVATAAAQTVPITGRAGETVGHVTAAGHATARETADLSRLLRPARDSDLPQVALLHTQVAWSGADRVHGPYAPSSLDSLRAAGFHYWALGHVHTRQELSGDPPIHYCGSLQGRNPGETGARGGLLVDLGDPAAPVVEFREFSPIRWEKLTVATLGDARTLDDVVGEVTAAWDAAREADPGEADRAEAPPGGAETGEPHPAEAETEWMVAVDLEGPSPIWRLLRDPQELETMADEFAARLNVIGVEVRSAKVHPGVRVEEHEERRDVLGATLQLARAVAAGRETLGLSETDLAGFDPDRDATLSAYLRRLLEGGSEEILVRMLDPEELTE